MTESAFLTDDERRGAVARHIGFGVGRKDQIDDPESRRVLNLQQDQGEQRWAQTSRGSHLFSGGGSVRTEGLGRLWQISPRDVKQAACFKWTSSCLRSSQTEAK